MDVDVPTHDELNEERNALLHGGHLRWCHWGILIMSGLLTVAVWYFSKSQVEAKTKLQFEREYSQVIDLISERMQKYEDALWSGVAAIQSNGGTMSHKEWRSFSHSLHIGRKYPGINGIGVIANIEKRELKAHIEGQRRLRPAYEVHPDHGETDSFPIVYIEPEGANAEAVGLDVAHEDNRYTAAKRARDTGAAQITGPIVLVQDEGKTPGFLFYVPYYQEGNYDELERRRENFLGMVYAPFVMKKLMAGTLEKKRRQVGIRISDGSDVLYDELHSSEEDFDPSPLYRSQITVEAYGRNWVFDVWSLQSFRTATQNSQPTLILAGGIVIDALLLTLFLMLSRASKNAIRFADRVTLELKQKATQLARSNSELESFAYVASHDLKTPIRGIGDLTSYLEEDLGDFLSKTEGSSEVQRHLDRIHQQVHRMENLIRGILDYSGVGVRAEAIETFEVGAVIESIRDQLKINEDQLHVGDGMPVLTTFQIRFEQVVVNLIGNAFKYHHDPEGAVVQITCEDRGECFHFSVADNGPGIDPKFHSRIFEVFQTLQSKDQMESTGVGLSIVKKSVEGIGGAIRVSSELGKGTRFTVEWPKATKAQPIVSAAS